MLQATPVFQSRIVHCPANPAEDQQCTGQLCIWSYLKLSGTIYTGSSMGPNNVLTPNFAAKSANILPQMVTIPFSVDFGTSVTKDVVHKCNPPVGAASPASSQPIAYTDDLLGGIYPVQISYTRASAPVVNPFDERKPCINGKVTFYWLATRVLIGGTISFGGGTPTNPIPLGNPISGGGGASGAAGLGGTPYWLEVSFEICYHDGCQARMIPTPDTCSDGEAVYASGGNP